MKAINIQWDVDNMEELADLPEEIEIPDGMTDDEKISDYISDFTGFCHKGFEIEMEASTENFIEVLKSGIKKAVSEIGTGMGKLNEASGSRRITEYMNIEHGIGKYHGLLEILETISLDDFVKVHDQYSNRIHLAMEKLEGLYHEERNEH